MLTFWSGFRPRGLGGSEADKTTKFRLVYQFSSPSGQKFVSAYAFLPPGENWVLARIGEGISTRMVLFSVRFLPGYPPLQAVKAVGLAL